MPTRTKENPAHLANINSMGASAVSMAWGQVAVAPSIKTAHAQFNVPAIIFDPTTLKKVLIQPANWFII